MMSSHVATQKLIIEILLTGSRFSSTRELAFPCYENSKLRQIPENLPGAPLPCSLQAFAAAAAGRPLTGQSGPGTPWRSLADTSAACVRVAGIPTLV